MSDRTDAAAQHFKTNRVSYTVASVIPILALIGAGFGFGTTMGAIVDSRLELHNLQDHAVVGKLTDALERIERRQLSEYIREIMIWQCLNPGDRTRDRELNDAQDEYRAITGNRLPDIDCNRVR